MSISINFTATKPTRVGYYLVYESEKSVEPVLVYVSRQKGVLWCHFSDTVYEYGWKWSQRLSLRKGK